MYEQSKTHDRLARLGLSQRWTDRPRAQFEVERALESGLVGLARRCLSRHGASAGEVLEGAPESWWFDRDELVVVVTGFGPFLQHSFNPSWRVAAAVAAELEGAFTVRTDRLAVTHAAVEEFAALLPWDDEDLFALHFGLGASREQVCMERYAHNCRGSTPDESQREGYAPFLSHNGPAARETCLPVDTLVESYEEEVDGCDGIPGARQSRDAGDYVCNNLYYRSLSAAASTRRDDGAAAALFTHVPHLDDSDADRLGRFFGRLLLEHLTGWFA
ncbi:MAG: hypothetical protein ACOCV2_01510 [Persicimonas sp.]